VTLHPKLRFHSSSRGFVFVCPDWAVVGGLSVCLITCLSEMRDVGPLGGWDRGVPRFFLASLSVWWMHLLESAVGPYFALFVQ
jgi:hypothetical protein